MNPLAWTERFMAFRESVLKQVNSFYFTSRPKNTSPSRSEVGSNTVRLALSVLTQTVSLVLPGDEGENMMNRKAPKIQFRILLALIAFVAMAASSMMVSQPASAAGKKT